MKYIVIIFLLFTSCVKIDKPKLLDITGKYVIDGITILNDSETKETKVFPGEIYRNEYDSYPLDSINVGFTKWYINNYQIMFNPTTLPTGKTIWNDKYYYSITNEYVTYDYGYIHLTLDNGSTRIFKILDDGLETLTLRTTGLWPQGQYGNQITITISLTRIGP